MEDRSKLDSHQLEARAHGVLATAMAEALAETRAALAPHAHLLPGETLETLDGMIHDFESRRIRIALYGEIKAGKSTLINAIAGAGLSPMAFDPLTSVPVRVTYGSQTVWHVGGDELHSLPELEQRMREGAGVAEVVVETPADVLQLGGQVDLLDTPGLGSDDQFDKVTNDLLASLDAVVLVVRYPALFTQFTRRLMERLQRDLTKMFVVWNLDTACAELTSSERSRHAATLREKVAGAHELFLVDARAGFAGRADVIAKAESGLATFTQALAKFVTSSGRDVASLRETAKRVQQYLAGVQEPLRQRERELVEEIAAAQERLDLVTAQAQQESDAVYGRFREFEAATARAAHEAIDGSKKNATELRNKIRAASRAWMRSGHLGGLERELAKVNREYAEGISNTLRAFLHRVRDLAAAFPAEFVGRERPRTELAIARLTTEDRNVRATSGRLRLLRRAMWRNWFLPGVATLEGATLDADVAAQAAWISDVGLQANAAASATTNRQVEEIAARAAGAAATIKIETQIDPRRSEHRLLTQNLPTIAQQIESIRQVSDEAKGWS